MVYCILLTVTDNSDYECFRAISDANNINILHFMVVS